MARKIFSILLLVIFTVLTTLLTCAQEKKSKTVRTEKIPKAYQSLITEDTIFIGEWDISEFPPEDFSLKSLFPPKMAEFMETEPQWVQISEGADEVIARLGALREENFTKLVLFAKLELDETGEKTINTILFFPCEGADEETVEFLTETLSYEGLQQTEDMFKIVPGGVIFNHDVEELKSISLTKPVARPDLEAAYATMPKGILRGTLMLKGLPMTDEEAKFMGMSAEFIEVWNSILDSDAYITAALMKDNMVMNLTLETEEEAENILKIFAEVQKKAFIDGFVAGSGSTNNLEIAEDVYAMHHALNYYERDGKTLRYDLKKSLENFSGEYLDWVEPYNGYVTKCRENVDKIDSKTEAKEIYDAVAPWLTPTTVAVAHVDLKRLNLVTATDTIIAQAQKYLPKTFSEGMPAAQAVAVYKTLATTLNAKKEQFVKVGAKDVYLLLDLVDPMNPVTAVIPVGKLDAENDTAKIAELQDLSGLEPFIGPEGMEKVIQENVVGYANNAIFYRVAPTSMKDAEVHAEYAQIYADLVAQNHADRPQFREGFRLGAKEAVQVVFAMNPLIQSQLEPLLEEFTENGNLANPGARVIARGLDTVMVSLDLHCATAKVRACSKTEVAARNMVKVANKWKEQILQNVENDNIPQATFIVQMYLDMLKLTQDGKDLSLEVSFDGLTSENPIFGKPSPAVVAAGVTGVSVALLLPAVQQARNAARRMQFMNNMKQLGLTALIHESEHRTYPPLFSVDEDGKPLHSWRVLILPYMEQKELYDQIRLDEPWDSEWNSQFHDDCPAVFKDPRRDLAPEETVISAVVGENTMFRMNGKGVRMAEIRDGTSSTILFVEKAEPFCWMDPTADIRFERVAREIYTEGEEFLVCLCNGLVTTISTYLLPDTLKNMFLINDQQVVDFFEDLSDEETVTENGPLFSEEEK